MMIIDSLRKKIHSCLLAFQQEHFVHIPTSPRNTILLSSMGRSGSTWIASLLNYSNTHREIFEPFLPNRVPEADVFEYLQYISPENRSIIYHQAAKNILMGRLRRQTWLDKDNKKMFSSKTMIKDIRTNLMLGWFSQQFPGMKIILLVRNPFSVVKSFLDLGWGVEPCGTRREIDILLNQKQLLIDYPEITKISQKIDLDDDFKSLFFQWCILNYVPLQQMKKYSFLLTFYENYLLRPEHEIRKIYAYAGLPIDSDVFKSLNNPSRTSYDKKDFTIKSHMFAKNQMIWGNEMLECFGLHNLYDEALLPLDTP